LVPVEERSLGAAFFREGAVVAVWPALNDNNRHLGEGGLRRASPPGVEGAVVAVQGRPGDNF
jgi:hypothetical protein